MARVVVAGAGVVGASVAYHLALLGAGAVVLVDRAGAGTGATGKGMGGVRQQFSTAAEVRLVQESLRFFLELGPPLFEQVGYLFLATTEPGLAALEARRATQVELGVPARRLDATELAEVVPGLRLDDVVGAVFCAADGVGDPPGVARELLRRAVELGVELIEGEDALAVSGDELVIACGAWSAELGARVGAELPVRPLCRQLIETEPNPRVDARLPMTIEHETGFHFRRKADAIVVAMGDPTPRWGFEQVVDEAVLPDRIDRLHRRYPPAAGRRLARAWAGLYDMTPDAHPIVGRVADGVFAACGFSGHGFMQAPAVGRTLAEVVLGHPPTVDLSPYRLERFRDGAVFREDAIL